MPLSERVTADPSPNPATGLNREGEEGILTNCRQTTQNRHRLFGMFMLYREALVPNSTLDRCLGRLNDLKTRRILATRRD
jgi:hypothetical protein